jgi:hypothetical protein
MLHNDVLSIRFSKTGQLREKYCLIIESHKITLFGNLLFIFTLFLAFLMSIRKEEGDTKLFFIRNNNKEYTLIFYDN